MTANSSLRLAVDIGGTFTDTVLALGDEIISSSKTLTTQAVLAPVPCRQGRRSLH